MKPLTVTEMARRGGKARAVALTPARRSAIAHQAAKAKKTHKGWPKGQPRGPRAEKG